jgi:hypothetical protein
MQTTNCARDNLRLHSGELSVSYAPTASQPTRATC